MKQLISEDYKSLKSDITLYNEVVWKKSNKKYIKTSFKMQIN